MTKKEMVKAITEETGLTQLQAKEVVQRVFDGILATLSNEGRIELRNFGVFEVRKRKPRRARNPRTGQSVEVPAKLVVTFKPGREMEKRVGRLKNVPNGRQGSWLAGTTEEESSRFAADQLAIPDHHDAPRGRPWGRDFSIDGLAACGQPLRWANARWTSAIATTTTTPSSELPGNGKKNVMNPALTMAEVYRGP